MKSNTLIELVDKCQQLHLVEADIIKKFIELRAKHGIVIEPHKHTEFDSRLATGLRKGYKRMHELGLIARIKRGNYVMNPWLFPCSNTHKQGEAQQLWKETEYSN